MLAAAAVLALVWVLTPAIAFGLGLLRVRVKAWPDPAAAEPTADDPDYRRLFEQFVALGFRPAGRSTEVCWFINPVEWRWESFGGIRWMTAADSKTLISFHRIVRGDPLRFGAVTVFEGGGFVRTASPGAGVNQQELTHLRMEVGKVEPAELIAKHEIHVMGFGSVTDRQVKQATFEEAARLEAAVDEPFLKKIGVEQYLYLLGYFVLPAMAGYLVSKRVAVAVCVGAAVFLFRNFVLLPMQLRRRVLSSHSPGAFHEQDMQERLEHAKTLVKTKRYDEATEELVWLWNNIERVQPAMGGVRVSFMAGNIGELVAAHPPARQRFAALRDAAEDKRLDWVVLNKALGDDERTLAWFDGVKADPGAASVVDDVSRFLIDTLKQRGRWADIGRLYKDPLAELAFQHDVFKSGTNPIMEKAMGAAFAQMRQIAAKMYRGGVADLVVSLRAADRAQEADAVRAEAIRLDPSDEMKQALET